MRSYRQCISLEGCEPHAKRSSPASAPRPRSLILNRARETTAEDSAFLRELSRTERLLPIPSVQTESFLPTNRSMKAFVRSNNNCPPLPPQGLLVGSLSVDGREIFHTAFCSASSRLCTIEFTIWKICCTLTSVEYPPVWLPSCSTPALPSSSTSRCPQLLFVSVPSPPFVQQLNEHHLSRAALLRWRCRLPSRSFVYGRLAVSALPSDLPTR